MQELKDWVKLKVFVNVKSFKDGMDYTCLTVLSISDKKYKRDHYWLIGKNNLQFKKQYNLLVQFKLKDGEYKVCKYVELPY